MAIGGRGGKDIHVTTNADKIRNMSDRELAKLFAKITDCYWCILKNSCCQDTEETCANRWRKWLKQKAEDF